MLGRFKGRGMMMAAIALAVLNVTTLIPVSKGTLLTPIEVVEVTRPSEWSAPSVYECEDKSSISLSFQIRGNKLQIKMNNKISVMDSVLSIPLIQDKFQVPGHSLAVRIYWNSNTFLYVYQDFIAHMAPGNHPKICKIRE